MASFSGIVDVLDNGSNMVILALRHHHHDGPRTRSRDQIPTHGKKSQKLITYYLLIGPTKRVRSQNMDESIFLKI